MTSSALMLALTQVIPVFASTARFTLPYAAVMISSWYGGLGPGIASALTCPLGSALVLTDVVHDVAREYEAVATEGGKRIVVSLDAALPGTSADPALLRRVLVNLIASALRHSGSSEVRIEALAEAGGVTLRVVDNGGGIAIEDQARIFEKFGTIRRSRSSEPTADTGLGLPFCKLAVERMGGSIRLTSRAGGPTVFAVTLPPPVSS